MFPCHLQASLKQILQFCSSLRTWSILICLFIKNDFLSRKLMVFSLKWLIVIHRRLFLSPGLPGVAPVAQGLPVAPVPEQFHVTTVWNYMVHIRRLHVPAFLHALCAQRVCLQEGFSCFPPGSSVASAGSGPYLLRVHRLVPFTIFLPWLYQLCTARMPAWYFWSFRHSNISRK